ncbi:hypothetical protein J6590_083485 [Homalodisca vitripennis]|nr:hypothetical protein J6590_083485 [Homalodisca vitripennis]
MSSVSVYRVTLSNEIKESSSVLAAWILGPLTDLSLQAFVESSEVIFKPLLPRGNAVAHRVWDSLADYPLNPLQATEGPGPNDMLPGPCVLCPNQDKATCFGSLGSARNPSSRF